MKTLTGFAFFAFVALAGCTEVVTQYRVDSSNRLVKVGTFQPEWGSVDRHLTYNIDGMLFTYDLSAIRGEIRGHRQPPTHLPHGQHLNPFSAMMDAPPFGSGKTWFGGFIGLAVDPRKGNLRPQQIRFINGRKWFVASDFEKDAAGIIKHRVFWTVEDGFFVSLHIDFIAAPLDPQWRQKRLDTLERIVSGFNMHRTA